MRTGEEVRATLQTAKLNPEELQPTVHCLTFSDNVTSGEYCLMELDEAICKHVESGKSLVIRGEKDEHAVLCSEDKTYDLKIADTSNLLLFIPNCKTPDQLPDNQSSQVLVHSQIYGFANSYWELRRCRPKTKKLKKVLMENLYEGPESDQEKNSNGSKYTTEDLLEIIQASEKELLDELQVIHACKIEGYWRILEFDYEMKLLGHVTQLVDSESWPFSKIPLNVCLEELGPLEPKEMIEHCLNCYSRRYTDEAGETYFALNEDKVCRVTAQMLLQNAVKFNLSEFQEVWQQSVPEGMTTRLDQLKGLALVDRNSRPETISLLKVEDLPEDTLDRFNSLFSIREKWTEADIAPYIEGLCGEKQSTGVLLTKYARSSMQNGIKVYNSRRPVL
ncbi:sister chromatid cohesion protein DCC1 [Latimeria chalumnae]|uniref:Sister chromatid cohesion protein DCC1 n=1 Tax=Latimeria chalumnae TaxID=7897 RepID=H3ASD7_LATCH|nr:PREDICTED: sister chromatid cohesion protein DCC1 [Latimeria chalumnae]|eukprot:XP_005994610.1 PREDICTED: sister chromatid cohesion protein DCC1 [Latimeria chalumnae]